jgi:DNA modification methylase/transcriptional regulator with XRE-family HTH domain
MLNQVLCGDSLILLRELESDSVDSIITDPPYELGFMGKKWDNTGIAYNAELWKECLRVLKPGGHVLSFGGTRTYHRMTCAIEDAGFEIRDMIEWVYGCLSEDTEILTPYGWERYNKTKHLNSNIPILIYDVENNFYKWENPKGWSEYSLNKDTCYRIKSDTTNQLVSRNHRCLVEREGKLIFIKAEELQEVEYMPILSNDFSILSERQRELLQSSMLWESKGLVKELFSKWFGEEKSEERSQDGKESCLERGSDLFQEERKLWEIQNQICEMSRAIYQYGEKGWLCNGTPIDNGKTFEKEFIENRSDTSQRPQSSEQSIREPNSIQEQQGTQNTRAYRITKAKVTKEEYSGLIFCPTVSTGCFLARRNGQIFITGNSGFPKSLNIAKMIDKRGGKSVSWFGNWLREWREKENIPQREVSKLFPSKTGGLTGCVANWELGLNMPTNEQFNLICKTFNLPFESLEETEREVLGKTITNKTVYQNIGGKNISGEIDKGTSEWEGWGTALKPAHEPICMARKPLSEKTIAENCLKWGTGGINIDESRVEGNWGGSPNRTNSPETKQVYGDYGKIKSEQSPLGRFPANLIHDNSEEVRECFPETGKSAGGRIGNKGYGDSGNASRFFKSIIYEPKASKSERNRGCKELEEKQYSYDGRNKEIENPYQRNKSVATNNHPTVKPLALMEYLIKMVTPEDGIVLDPFAGSGTTLVACKRLNRNYIGIELEEDYIPIIEARLSHIDRQFTLKNIIKNRRVNDSW